ncbi:MAG TPA: hypothetical protein VGQ62_11055, partial [Chloroflexota bacterium]|nr:hypothetical protein [Chloroflexota bacterium]
VVARRVGQGLRDANLAIAHDRPRLRLERQKLIFLDATSLEAVLASGDAQPAREAALFVHGAHSGSALLDLLAQRERAGLVSFVAATRRLDRLSHWRILDLAIAPAAEDGRSHH